MPHHDEAKVAAVLHDYRETDKTVEVIAADHGVSLPTVGSWVKRAKLPLRGRGRRKKTAPDEMDMRVLSLVEIHTYEQTATKLKTTKQNISRIVKKWRDYKQPKKPPFVPGDVLRWTGEKGAKGEKVCVISADVDRGMVRDSRGNLIRAFTWTRNGKPTAVKIGHDPKFGAGRKGRN